jgi:hypothetical protein
MMSQEHRRSQHITWHCALLFPPKVAGASALLQASASSAGWLGRVLVCGASVLTLAVVLAATAAGAKKLLVLRGCDVVDHLVAEATMRGEKKKRRSTSD